jgi:dTDP-4-amino-4,6-dideoxy-D-galactose acyltransferase
MAMPADAAAASPTLCEKLEWDSTFFGRSIARAVPSQITDETCRAIVDWCVRQRIECLYFLAADDGATGPRLERAGFRLVDIRVTFERPVDATVDVVPTGVRPAQTSDLPALRHIAGISHRDTRFHTDPHFDRARSDELYRIWIENSCRGYADHVVVTERDGQAVGYLTLHVDEERARIGLVGVHPEWRRQGVGHDLVRGGLAWLAGQSARHVSVVTQGGHLASPSVYERAGFRESARARWYHRWFNDDDWAGRANALRRSG